MPRTLWLQLIAVVASSAAIPAAAQTTDPGLDPPAVSPPEAPPQSTVAVTSGPGAAEPERDPRVKPTVEHVPVAMALNEAPITIEVGILHPDLLARAIAHYRVQGNPTWNAVPIDRSATVGYVARLPPQPRSVHTVDYYITLETADGPVREAFASAARPHTIVLHPTPEAERENRELALYDWHRWEFTLGSEYANFGTRPDPSSCGGDAAHPCEDYWYSIYGQARYHFSRWVRTVTVRAERLAGVTSRFDPMTNSDRVRTIGLVAATATVEFRLADAVSWHLATTIGANEDAVQGGIGTMLEFGIGTPTRIQLAFNGITNYGISASGWMRWYTVPETPMGIGIEVTNQPGAGSTFGARLLFEASRRFGRHLTIAARVGYGSRNPDASGLTLGAQAQFAF